jgi:hypothetical protein
MFVSSPNRTRLLRNVPGAFSLTLYEMVNSSYGERGVAQEQQSFVVFIFMMTNVLRSGLDSLICHKIRGAKPFFLTELSLQNAKTCRKCLFWSN